MRTSDGFRSLGGSARHGDGQNPAGSRSCCHCPPGQKRKVGDRPCSRCCDHPPRGKTNPRIKARSWPQPAPEGSSSRHAVIVGRLVSLPLLVHPLFPKGSSAFAPKRLILLPALPAGVQHSKLRRHPLRYCISESPLGSAIRASSGGSPERRRGWVPLGYLGWTTPRWHHVLLPVYHAGAVRLRWGAFS